MKCTQCGKEWKQMEDIHLPCCPRCTKLHQGLKALIEAKGETILGTLQFRGYIADLAPRTETHHKRIFRQALADNLDKKLWEIVKENGAGLEIDSLKYNFKTMNGYTNASDYVVDSFLYAFGRISEDKIGGIEQISPKKVKYYPNWNKQIFPKKVKHYSNGNKYEGQIKSNKRHGQGTYHWSDGDKYVGQWKEDKKHGQGTYYWADGKKYVGQFKEGKSHGQGTCYKANGSKYSQIWENNEIQKVPVWFRLLQSGIVGIPLIMCIYFKYKYTDTSYSTIWEFLASLITWDFFVHSFFAFLFSIFGRVIYEDVILSLWKELLYVGLGSMLFTIYVWAYAIGMLSDLPTWGSFIVSFLAHIIIIIIWWGVWGFSGVSGTKSFKEEGQ